MKYYLPSIELESTEAQAPEQELEPWQETRVVGQRMSRVDAYERVSGSAVYTLDLVCQPGHVIFTQWQLQPFRKSTQYGNYQG